MGLPLATLASGELRFPLRHRVIPPARRQLVIFTVPEPSQPVIIRQTGQNVDNPLNNSSDDAVSET